MAIEELELQLEQYRGELVAYCYRMLGSAYEAEDAVQETLVRAWRAHDRFEGRTALRRWLYKIATNACLDLLRSRQRRALPMDLTAPSTVADRTTGRTLPEQAWVTPLPDGAGAVTGEDPADIAVGRDTIRLAFVAALQYLPPRQRAVLILREVLHWRAAEVAELLDASVVSVNSALQRARATLAAVDVGATDPAAPDDEEQRALLERYVDAFERYDIEALVALLHEDATLAMPPNLFWLRGRSSLEQWWHGEGAACRGSRTTSITANGAPAVAAYRPVEGGGYEAGSIHIIEASAGRIGAIHVFLDPGLFVLFGLPIRLEDRFDGRFEG